MVTMWAVYRTDRPPGPAGRWFIDCLKQEHAPPLKEETSRSAPAPNAAAVAGRRSSRRSPAVKRRRGR